MLVTSGVLESVTIGLNGVLLVLCTVQKWNFGYIIIGFVTPVVLTGRWGMVGGLGDRFMGVVLELELLLYQAIIEIAQISILDNQHREQIFLWDCIPQFMSNYINESILTY